MENWQFHFPNHIMSETEVICHLDRSHFHSGKMEEYGRLLAASPRMLQTLKNTKILLDNLLIEHGDWQIEEHLLLVNEAIAQAIPIE